MATNFSDLFTIETELALFFVDMLTKGDCIGKREYYKKHKTIPDAYIVLLDVILPKQSHNQPHAGTLKLVSMTELEYTEPHLSTQIKGYGKTMYAGFSIYTHPEHKKKMDSILSGVQPVDIYERVGLVLLKQRGCFTFNYL